MRVPKTTESDQTILDYAAIHEVVRAAEARRALYAGRAMAAFARLLWQGMRRHGADVAAALGYRSPHLRTETPGPR